VQADEEDGGGMFLRNVGELLQDYTLSHLRKKSWPVSKYCLRMLLEELREAIETSAL
jgi:hypothetical protein